MMKIFFIMPSWTKKACKLERTRIIGIITTATKDKLSISNFKVRCQACNFI